MRVRLWTDADIERVRELLPKIANGQENPSPEAEGKEKSRTGQITRATQKRKPKKK